MIHEPRVLKEIRAFLDGTATPTPSVWDRDKWLSWCVGHIDKLTENNRFMEKRVNELESEIQEYQANLPPLEEHKR